MATQLCGFLSLARLPVFFEPHRADIAQREVQSPVVEEHQPVDDLVHHFTVGGENHPPYSQPTFQLPHMLSVGALSQQLPLRLIELLMP